MIINACICDSREISSEREEEREREIEIHIKREINIKATYTLHMVNRLLKVLPHKQKE